MSKIKKNRIHFLKSRMKLYEERILAKDLIQKLGKPLRLRGLSLHYSSSQSLETSLASYLSAFSVFCGQLPRKTRAKKSIAGFHLRSHELLGCCQELRGEVMYNFLGKWIQVNLPKSGSGHGKTSLKLRTHANMIQMNENFLECIELERMYTFLQDPKEVDLSFLIECETDQDLALLISGLQIPIPYQ